MVIAPTISSEIGDATSFVAVIGAGPAGLMAAQRLAEAGCRVTVFDRMPSPARKFLMAGRGGLNLTHSEPLETFLDRYTDDTGRIRDMVTGFPPKALLAWANDLGIETFVGTSGRVFPTALKASPLLRAWIRRLDELGVTFRFRHDWTGWRGADLVFDVSGPPESGGAGKVARVNADAVVLALGGASWPRLGSHGAWQSVLAAQGIAVAPLQPFNSGALVAWSPHLLARHEGAPLKRIALSCAGKRIRGEAVITRQGLEGGAVYALNGEISAQLSSQGGAKLDIDLRPDLGVDALTERLSRNRGRQSQSNFFRKATGLSTAAIGILREPGQGGLPADASEQAALIKAVPLQVTGLSGLARAISSSGGICMDEIDPNAMLVRRPGVFVAGEMLDWAAPTGGYLLQATFASAVHAADGVISWLRQCDTGAPWPANAGKETM